MRDLAAEEDFSVLVADVDPVVVERLTVHGADGVVVDLSDPETVSKVVVDADLVVSAVPGFMGYSTVERVLQEGCPVVDISFFREDAFGLDDLAKEAGVPCLVDCGVSPGLSNLILGRLEEHLDETYSYHCLVGGLPRGTGVAVGVQGPVQSQRRDSDLQTTSSPSPPRRRSHVARSVRGRVRRISGTRHAGSLQHGRITLIAEDE